MNPSRRVVHVRTASLWAGVAAAGLALALAGCSATNPATIATPFDPAEGRNAQLGGEPGNGGGDGNYQGNGGVKLRNFLVVSQGSNQPGVVVGALSNDTGQPAQLTLTLGSAGASGSSGQVQPLGSTTVTVPPGGFVQLGNPLAGGGSGSAGGSATAGGAGATTSPTSSVAPTTVPSAGAGASGSQSAGTSSAVGTEPAPGQVVWFQVSKVSQPPGSFLQLLARDPQLGSVTMDLPIQPPLDEYASLTPTAAPPSGSVTGRPTGSPQPTANPSGAAHQTTPPTPSAPPSS